MVKAVDSVYVCCALKAETSQSGNYYLTWALYALVYDKYESRLSFCACLDTRIVYISHDKNRFRAINTKQHKTEAQKALCACTGLSQRLGRHSSPTMETVSIIFSYSFSVVLCVLLLSET